MLLLLVCVFQSVVVVDEREFCRCELSWAVWPLTFSAAEWPSVGARSRRRAGLHRFLTHCLRLQLSGWRRDGRSAGPPWQFQLAHFLLRKPPSSSYYPLETAHPPDGRRSSCRAGGHAVLTENSWKKKHRDATTLPWTADRISGENFSLCLCNSSCCQLLSTTVRWDETSPSARLNGFQRRYCVQFTGNMRVQQVCVTILGSVCVTEQKCPL